jgi:RNA polymerase sigma-70 factor (ECF subfamily)
MTVSPDWKADLTLARAGDRDALGRILDAVRSHLHCIASRELSGQVRSKEDESDLVQQTFAEATRSFPHFRGASAEELEAWLRRILLDNVHSSRRGFHTRKRNVRREKSLAGHDSDLPGSDRLAAYDPEPLDVLMALERAAALAAAVARLPVRYREVVRLRNQDGLPFDEIGARLGLSGDAAQKLWSRAVGRLGQNLGKSI